MHNTPILEIKNLTVDFDTPQGIVQAVRGIDISLHRGETVAIVGESGSGKSVTAKSILGVLPSYGRIGGSIAFEGKEILGISEKQMCNLRGKRIAMIGQDPFSVFDPTMTVGRQIAEVFCDHMGQNRRQAKESTIALMDSVGIPRPNERYSAYPFQLSGGMLQRVSIAMALAGQPDILICDEPTTALDVTVQGKILELINRIQEERGLSIIFITHDFGVVANMADKIYVLYAGRVAEYGLATEIFFDPRHPYTWALLSALPDMTSPQHIEPIYGAPPDMLAPPLGDAFAMRSSYALGIDMRLPPPMFKISDTHFAATWLLHPNAPKADMPQILKERIERMLREEEQRGGKSYFKG